MNRFKMNAIYLLLLACLVIACPANAEEGLDSNLESGALTDGQWQKVRSLYEADCVALIPEELHESASSPIVMLSIVHAMRGGDLYDQHDGFSFLLDHTSTPMADKSAYAIIDFMERLERFEDRPKIISSLFRYVLERCDDPEVRFRLTRITERISDPQERESAIDAMTRYLVIFLDRERYPASASLLSDVVARYAATEDLKAAQAVADTYRYGGSISPYTVIMAINNATPKSKRLTIDLIATASEREITADSTEEEIIGALREARRIKLLQWEHEKSQNGE